MQSNLSGDVAERLKSYEEMWGRAADDETDAAELGSEIVAGAAKPAHFGSPHSQIAQVR